MGCWCSSVKLSQQSGVAESPLTCSAGLAVAEASAALSAAPGKTSFQLVDQNLLTVRLNRDLFDPSSDVDPGCSDDRDIIIATGGAASVHNSMRQHQPSISCGQQPVFPSAAPGGLRALQNSDFEDHAGEDTLEGNDNEKLCDVSTLAGDTSAATACRTAPNATADDGDGGTARSDADNVDDGDDSDSDILKSSRQMLQSVVPLLLNPSTATASAATTVCPPVCVPPTDGSSRVAAPTCTLIPATTAMPILRPAAAAVDQAQHPTPQPGISEHVTAGTGAFGKRSTFLRGLTRDSFLLNNTNTGGTTACSGYMLRTGTGRGELLLQAGNCWPPFQMGNPLQVQMGELLGRGGCGSVYRGQWQGRAVAVKVVQQVVMPPAGAAAATAAAAAACGGGGGYGVRVGGAQHPQHITPVVDYFNSAEGDWGEKSTDCVISAVGGSVARAPHLPDAHISVKRLRHPNVLRTYAYAVLSAAPQLDGVLPARHEHHVVLELCEGGSLRSWLDKLYCSGDAGPVGTACAAVPVTAGLVAKAHQQQQASALSDGGGGSGRGADSDTNASAVAAVQLAAQNALDRAQVSLNDIRGPTTQDHIATGGTLLHPGNQRHCHQPPCKVQYDSHHCPSPVNPIPLQEQQSPAQQQLQQQPQYEALQLPSLCQKSAAPTEQANAIAAWGRSSTPSTDAVLIASPHGREEMEEGPPRTGAFYAGAISAALSTAAAAAAAASERTKPLSLVTALQMHSHAGGGGADGGGVADAIEHIRSSLSVSEVISRRLPGLTPAQSEQLHLLGMAWVSDSQVQVGMERECQASGRIAAGGVSGSGGGGGRDDGGGDGGNGCGKCMAYYMEGVETGGAAGPSVSDSSTGTECSERLDTAAVVRRNAGGSGNADLDCPAWPQLLPQLGMPSGSDELVPDRADTTMQAYTAFGNASAGSGAGSTMVRMGSSSCVAFHAVQQYCMVLDDDTADDDDCGVDRDGLGGGPNNGDGNAAPFGDLRLRERLDLVEEVSGEGQQSSRSRCASASATASSVAATTTPTDTIPALARHNTYICTLSSNGGVGASAATASTARPGPPAPLLAQVTAADRVNTMTPPEPHPSPLGRPRFPGGTTQWPVAGLSRPAPPRSQLADAMTDGGATAAPSEREHLLQLPAYAPGKEPTQPLGYCPQSRPQLPPPPPPPSHMVTETPLPLQGEFDTSAVTALLNRRAVGMVSSILRAAGGNPRANAGSVGIGIGEVGGRIAAAADAVSLAEPAPEPMQPSQLRYLVTALDCLVEIASGLSYLHGVGMVHGDVKSGNVLLKMDPKQPRGFVLKLADFGFSRVLENGSHTYLSRPSGTLAYLSPEMLISHRQSAAADQYAFGLLIWEVVTTQPLFRGLQTPQLLYAKTHNADWKYLVWPPWCPMEVRTLARHCSDYQPAARVSAAEARDKLEAMRTHYQGILLRS